MNVKSGCKYFCPIFLLVIFYSNSYCQSIWQQGFNSGYKEGYCYNKFGCVSPVPPVVTMNIGDSFDTFKDGYNSGFKRGLEDSRKSSFGNSSNGSTNRWVVQSNAQAVQSLEQKRTEARADLDKWESEKNQEKRALMQTVQNYHQSFRSYPASIANGWHVVMVTNNLNFVEERKVWVNANRIEKYVKEDWRYLKVNNSTTVSNAKALVEISGENIRSKWDHPVQQNSSLEVYFIDYLSDPTLETTSPMPTGTVMFCLLSKKKAQTVTVQVENIYVGEIAGYYNSDLQPRTCGINGCLTFPYKTGTYKYFAYSTKQGFFGSRQTSWSGTITVKQDDCNIFRLLKE